jgi:hypothetical protein
MKSCSAGKARSSSSGPAFTRVQLNAIRYLLAQGTANVAQIAKAAGMQRQTLYCAKADPAATGAAWGLRSRTNSGPSAVLYRVRFCLFPTCWSPSGRSW